MFKCLNSPCCASFKGEFNEIQSFFSSNQVPFQIIEGQKKGSRYRSKLAVRGTIEKPLIGLFKPRSHEVYEIPACQLHHEKINEAVFLIKKWITESKIIPYQEKGHAGLLRYIQCIVERSSSKVQISLCINAKSKSFELEKALQNLINSIPSSFLHSLWINYNPKPGNTIFSSQWERVFGKEWIEENIAGIPLCYLPGSFGQANPDLFEQLIGSIKKYTPQEKRVGEFYAGVGAIGLSLAENSVSLTLNEVNPESKICFDEIKKRLPNEILSKVSYRLEKAENALELLSEIDIAIVDPPRKGLDLSFIEALSVSSVETLIYVSCGWPSLIRDLDLLKKLGWKITKAEGYPFFPGTPHLETLCFISR